jgi:hypothetical protein
MSKSGDLAQARRLSVHLISALLNLVLGFPRPALEGQGLPPSQVGDHPWLTFGQRANGPTWPRRQALLSPHPSTSSQ